MRTTFVVRSREVLDNTEADWLEYGLHPLTPEGGFPANNAHRVDRLTPVVLVVTNTEGEVMVFVVKGISS